MTVAMRRPRWAAVRRSLRRGLRCKGPSPSDWHITPASLQTVAFALVDTPYGASRRYLLAGKPPPPTVDELIVRTCRCVLSLGPS